MGLFDKVQVITRLWYDDYLIVEDGVIKIIQSNKELPCSYGLYRDYDSALGSFFKKAYRNYKDAVPVYRNGIYSMIYKQMGYGHPIYINDFKELLTHPQNLKIIESKNFSVETNYAYIQFKLQDGTYISYSDPIYRLEIVDLLSKCIKNYSDSIYLCFDYTEFSKISFMLSNKINSISLEIEKSMFTKGIPVIHGILLDTELDIKTSLMLGNLIKNSVTSKKDTHVVKNLYFCLKWGTCIAFTDNHERFGFDIMGKLDHSVVLYYNLVNEDSDFWKLVGLDGTNASGDWDSWEVAFRSFKKNECHFYSLDCKFNIIRELPITEFKEF